MTEEITERIHRAAEAAERLSDYIIGLRREFHADPELALQEFHTADRIASELERIGIPYGRVTETGIVAVLDGTGTEELPAGADLPEIALRADIDALPIREENQVPYCSRNAGRMHACGHDGHTAMLLGAARLLAEERESFAGRIRFIFQPAEEIGAGARLLLKDPERVLGNAGRVFGIHCAPDLRSGTIGIKSGVNNASVDHFTIRIRGRASHVCQPQRGADAVYIGSSIVTQLQAVVSRMTSPVEPVIIGVGRFEGGDAYNVVAGSAVLEGTTRNVTDQNRSKVNGLVDRIARETAETFGGSAETAWEDYASVLTNPADICSEVRTAEEAVFGRDHIITDREVFLSGDDFAEYQRYVSGVYAYLGVGNPDIPGTQNAFHTPSFGIDEGALAGGTAAYAAYALWWLLEGHRKGRKNV